MNESELKRYSTKILTLIIINFLPFVELNVKQVWWETENIVV